MKHLWEIDHPYYGSDVNANACESFDELRQCIDRLDDGMNHLYRWDWQDWSQPYGDGLGLTDAERGEQVFTAYLVLPRNGMLINFHCPITHDQEPDVLEWLRGRRVLGALRELWEPILDERDASTVAAELQALGDHLVHAVADQLVTRWQRPGIEVNELVARVLKLLLPAGWDPHDTRDHYRDQPDIALAYRFQVDGRTE